MNVTDVCLEYTHCKSARYVWCNHVEPSDHVQNLYGF